MFKFAAAVIDFYDDPEFTKEADLFNEALVAPDKMHTLRDVDFAVKIASKAGFHRKFPTYNKTATALSGQYFERNASGLPESIRKVAGYHLRAAHIRHGIELPRSLEQAFEATPRVVSFQSENDEAGMVAGTSILKTAQALFEENYDRMDVLERVSRAMDMSKAAQVENTPITSRYVHEYIPKNQYGPFLEKALLEREALVADDGVLKEAFAQVLVEFAKMDPMEGPFLLYHFDKVAGLNARYRTGVTDPFYAAWAGVPTFTKEAAGISELEYKLATIARQSLLSSILNQNAQAEFARSPIAAYERWKTAHPEWRKVVDTLLKNIPTKDIEETTKQIQKDMKAAEAKARSASDLPDNHEGRVGWGEKLNVGL